MTYERVLNYARINRRNQTLAELAFWKRVRKRQLIGMKFLRQYIIQHTESEGKTGFFIADFYCHEKKLIVEIDGQSHRDRMEYDKIREALLKERGYSIFRITNHEVLNNWKEVQSTLEAWLSATKPQ